MEPKSKPAQMLAPGDHAPWFHAAALSGNPSYAFDTAAGRHIVLLFLGAAKLAPAAEALALARRERALFDDRDASIFRITVDPEDAAQGRIAQQLPGLRFFLDYDREVSRLYGAAEDAGYRPHWLVLDPALRVAGRFPIDRGEEALALLRTRIAAAANVEQWAPVLVVHDIVEPALCAELIRGYEASGGEPSGFMREVDGKTVMLLDPAHKQRRDWTIGDEKVRRALHARIVRRLCPAVARGLGFRATRIERYIVACYEARAGHFRPHRDNTTKGTAHRRFAVTINLNAGDYDGGDVRFPEFGRRTYRAPTGGAIVFSCSLLHEATPVTRGTRYAFLPFLYDEEGARLRAANNPHLGEGVGAYRMGDSRVGG